MSSWKLVPVREAESKLRQLIAEACRGEVIVLTDGDNQVTLEPGTPLDLEVDTPELEAELLKAAQGPFTPLGEGELGEIRDKALREHHAKRQGWKLSLERSEQFTSDFDGADTLQAWRFDARRAGLAAQLGGAAGPVGPRKPGDPTGPFLAAAGCRRLTTRFITLARRGNRALPGTPRSRGLPDSPKYCKLRGGAIGVHQDR